MREIEPWKRRPAQFLQQCAKRVELVPEPPLRFTDDQAVPPHLLAQADQSFRVGLCPVPAHEAEVELPVEQLAGTFRDQLDGHGSADASIFTGLSAAPVRAAQ